MDEFARLPGAERRLYFEQAAARLGRSAQIIEKDFWVCWCLRRLFSRRHVRDFLTFKGGTSLSRVYSAIDRFSEDVDISIERSFLGFGGENEPEQAASGKQRKRRIAELMKACQAAITDRLHPQLHQSIASTLGTQAGWNLALDPTDPDRQTLLFEYPPALVRGLSPYIAGSVKIEMGARSDHYPVEHRAVVPYLCDAIPDAIVDAQANVRVLAAPRTFWEKATILHMLHHLPEGKRINPRMSRHYYDVFRLSHGEVVEQALSSREILYRVAEFKDVYFKAAWARYADASRGMLRLMPRQGAVPELVRDYEDMQHMFFSEPPPFSEILAFLPELEKRINEIK